MAQRYTYFRMPNGKPHRGEDDKHSPIHVLSEIGETSKLNADGTVSWSGSFIKRADVALRSGFVILTPDGSELNETDAFRLVWKALVAVIKNAPGEAVIPKHLITTADKCAAEFFREPRRSYILVSSLSVSSLPRTCLRVGGCTVSPLAARGDKFPLPSVLRAASHISHFADHMKSTKYQLVQVATEVEAVSRQRKTR